jgi:3',5'-cyclic AMP phosphodiesterase CpdA
MNFLHLSDLHTHGAREKNTAVDDALQFTSAQYPNHIRLLTGDLTDDGTEAQYERLRENLSCRDIICPGNHDFGVLGNLYSPDAALRFAYLCESLEQPGCFAGDCLPAVTYFDDVRVIALDSNLETLNPLDFSCGEIGETQLAALPRLLDTEDFVVLMCHHHPFIHYDPTMVLQDADALRDIIEGKVDLLLFGHKHVTNHWRDVWDIPDILAADALYEANFAREIIVEDGHATINIVPVREGV